MKGSTALHGAFGYRWFRVWILLGIGLAILLLVNSIWNYFLVSQRVLVEQVRRDLSRQIAGLDRRVQEGGPRTVKDLGSRIEQVRQENDGKMAWIHVRDGEGAILARAGLEVAPAFQAELVRSRFRERQPTFKTLQTNAGQVVVEAFPFRLPLVVGLVAQQASAKEPRPPRQLGILEVAVFLDSARAAFWPLRRNLIINCSAALALLVSLTVMGVRFGSYLEGKQLEKEIARRVQQDLLPSPKPLPEQFQLAAEYVPASGVGGDFYDVFPVNGAGAAFVLGDVSGKGIPAALLMGVIHGAVRSTPWTQSPRHHEESTRQINRLLWERASQERFASLFWGYFDPETRLLRYVNAGHFPPLLFEAGAKTPIPLTDGGPVLGLLPNARFQQGAVRFAPGDVLVLYSDGVLEAADAAGAQFGQERLAAAVERSLDGTADEIRDHILASVRTFSGRTPRDDDRTLLVVRYQEVAAGQTGNLGPGQAGMPGLPSRVRVR